MTVEILRDFKSRLYSDKELMKCAYVDNADMLYDDARELNFTMAYDNHIMKLSYPSLEDRKAAYARVTPEDIRRAACEIFTPKNLTVTLKGKKKRIDCEKIKQIISKL